MELKSNFYAEAKATIGKLSELISFSIFNRRTFYFPPKVELISRKSQVWSLFFSIRVPRSNPKFSIPKVVNFFFIKSSVSHIKIFVDSMWQVGNISHKTLLTNNTEFCCFIYQDYVNIASVVKSTGMRCASPTPSEVILPTLSVLLLLYSPLRHPRASCVQPSSPTTSFMLLASTHERAGLNKSLPLWQT